MKRAARSLVALAVLAVAALGAVGLVRLSNGDYSGDYALSGVFPRAGEGLQSGSEVVFRGVQVGRVSTIELDGTRARITVLMDPSFKVPADTVATVEPVNLFGAEQVTLSTPPSASTGGVETEAGPYLAPGGTFTHTATSDELGDLFAAAAPLLNRVNTENLASVISDFGQASDGEGPQIAQAIGAGARLANSLDQSLQAQLAALDSFSRFTAAIAPDGSAINGLSAQENLALPTFNADVADYQRLLDNLTTFSSELARLLTDYHPDIATLLTQGADVAQVLTTQQAEIGQVIRGAYEYAYKVSKGGGSATLANGSKFAYFNSFILFGDVNSLVCDLLAPPDPNMAFLEPLQQALAGAGTPFDCQSQLAAFDAAQKTSSVAGTATPAATPTSAAVAPSGSTSTPTQSIAGTAQTLANQIYGIIGRPSSSSGKSIGSYVKSLLGGGS
ncbi:MAG: MCE family protein [Actinomycetota bacterium]|nr:MCE family protein [Actinomycetota bacterium]